uniref:Uncharacterized protein n=1 Tax=Arion vulgaris TaxID=1028688 RepID=A0A0B7BCY6_9EUPU
MAASMFILPNLHSKLKLVVDKLAGSEDGLSYHLLVDRLLQHSDTDSKETIWT